MPAHNEDKKRSNSAPDLRSTKRTKASQGLVNNKDIYSLESQLIPEDVARFFPSGSPEKYPDGRIPLRYQIYSNKKILYTVLTKPKKGVYMCSHCDDLFVNFGDLLDHFDKFDIKRPYKCTYDDCPWTIVGFNRLRQLQRHSASVHNTARAFSCTVPGCDKSFGRMDLLNRHIKSVHENKLSRFNKKFSKTSPSSSPSGSSQTSPLIHAIKPAYQQHPGQFSPLPFTQLPVHPHLLHGHPIQQQPHAPQQQYAQEPSPSQSNAPVWSQDTNSQQSLADSPMDSEDSRNSVNPSDTYYKHSIKFLTNDDRL